jgi:hypothetical protein
MVTAWDKDGRKINGSFLSSLVLQRYPLAKYDMSPSAAYIQANADATVICPTHALARTLMSRGQSGHTSGHTDLHGLQNPTPIPTFVFAFAHFQASGCDCGVGLDVVAPGMASSLNWACHDADTKYVFGTEWGPDPDGPPNKRVFCPYNGTGELELTNTMQGLWGALAHNYAAHDELQWNQVRWPSYLPPSTTAGGAAAERTLQFATSTDGGTGVLNGYKSDDCAFWEEVGSYGQHGGGGMGEVRARAAAMQAGGS